MSKRVDSSAHIIAKEVFPSEPWEGMSTEKKVWCRRVGVLVAINQPAFFTEEHELLLEFAAWIDLQSDRFSYTQEALVNAFLKNQNEKFINEG